MWIINFVLCLDIDTYCVYSLILSHLIALYHQTNVKIELARIRDLASTVDEFDKIAVRIAVELTLRNQSAIEKLNGAVLPKDMKFYASIFIKQGMQSYRCLFCSRRFKSFHCVRIIFTYTRTKTSNIC